MVAIRELHRDDFDVEDHLLGDAVVFMVDGLLDPAQHVRAVGDGQGAGGTGQRHTTDAWREHRFHAALDVIQDRGLEGDAGGLVAARVTTDAR
ncbi:hypothetical protein D3C84_1007000 [compost metagenome]